MKRQPKPGERVVGCRHAPDPWTHANVFYVDPPQPFDRGDGVSGEAHWMLVCDACLSECRHPREILLGCDCEWPEDAPPIVYEEPS